jgi:hypothetical protein
MRAFDPDIMCSKCGGTNINKVWRHPIPNDRVNIRNQPIKPRDEHLVCDCTTCGYVFRMEVLVSD